MLIILSRAWNGDDRSYLCAYTGLAMHLEGAAQGLDPLAHARQAQGPRLAVALAVRGETLAIVDNNDPELVRPTGCEGDRGRPCSGVLAHVGQRFLNEPE